MFDFFSTVSLMLATICTKRWSVGDHWPGQCGNEAVTKCTARFARAANDLAMTTNKSWALRSNLPANCHAITHRLDWLAPDIRHTSRQRHNIATNHRQSLHWRPIYHIIHTHFCYRTSLTCTRLYFTRFQRRWSVFLYKCMLSSSSIVCFVVLYTVYNMLCNSMITHRIPGNAAPASCLVYHRVIFCIIKYWLVTTGCSQWL